MEQPAQLDPLFPNSQLNALLFEPFSRESKKNEALRGKTPLQIQNSEVLAATRGFLENDSNRKVRESKKSGITLPTETPTRCPVNGRKGWEQERPRWGVKGNRPGWESGGPCRRCKGAEGCSLPPSSTPQPGPPDPKALTHPEVVEALGHAEMLGRDVCLKVLVETRLQRDKFGQWWEVIHFLCG